MRYSTYEHWAMAVHHFETIHSVDFAGMNLLFFVSVLESSPTNGFDQIIIVGWLSHKIGKYNFGKNFGHWTELFPFKNSLSQILTL